MNGHEHYEEAERLLMVESGNPLGLWAALTHAVLALVATEEQSTEEIHNLAAAALEGNGHEEPHEPYPGGLA